MAIEELHACSGFLPTKRKTNYMRKLPAYILLFYRHFLFWDSLSPSSLVGLRHFPFLGLCIEITGSRVFPIGITVNEGVDHDGDRFLLNKLVSFAGITTVHNY